MTITAIGGYPQPPILKCELSAEKNYEGTLKNDELTKSKSQIEAKATESGEQNQVVLEVFEQIDKNANDLTPQVPAQYLEANQRPPEVPSRIDGLHSKPYGIGGGGINGGISGLPVMLIIIPKGQQSEAAGNPANDPLEVTIDKALQNERNSDAKKLSGYSSLERNNGIKETLLRSSLSELQKLGIRTYGQNQANGNDNTAAELSSEIDVQA